MQFQWAEVNTATNNITTFISSSPHLFDHISITLWKLVPPVLLIFGTLGNVMIVVVMRGMRMSESTACLSVYFTALAVSDQCLLLTSAPYFWVEQVFSWPPSFYYYDLLCRIPAFMFYTCPLTSAWLLVAMTYQRVTSVVAPHRVAVLCTVRRGKMVISAVVTFACVVNSHFLFTFSYRHEYRECIYQEAYVYFVYLFTWLDLFWASAIPFVLLIVGNSVLIWHVIKSVSLSRKMRGFMSKETSGNGTVYPMTVTLILTSAVFLILTLPVCVFHAYRRSLHLGISDDNIRAMLNFVETVSLLLWCGASASNFYLYLLSGTKFRQETKRHLCWHREHQMK